MLHEITLSPFADSQQKAHDLISAARLPDDLSGDRVDVYCSNNSITTEPFLHAFLYELFVVRKAAHVSLFSPRRNLRRVFSQVCEKYGFDNASISIKHHLRTSTTQTDAAPTDSDSLLDLAVGVGGFPTGRIGELIGAGQPRGKTAMILDAVRDGGPFLGLDVEPENSQQDALVSMDLLSWADEQIAAHRIALGNAGKDPRAGTVEDRIADLVLKSARAQVAYFVLDVFTSNHTEWSCLRMVRVSAGQRRIADVQASEDASVTAVRELVRDAWIEVHEVSKGRKAQVFTVGQHVRIDPEATEEDGTLTDALSDLRSAGEVVVTNIGTAAEGEVLVGRVLAPGIGSARDAYVATRFLSPL